MKKLLLLLVLPILALHLRADPPVWKNVALGGGGAVIGICADPNVPGLVYMRTDVGGAYRWDAVNSRWIPITEKLPDGGDSNDFGIDSLNIDPSNGKTVYILTGKYLYGKKFHLYKSTDAGDNWTALATPPGLKSNSNGPARKYGERIGIDPNDPQVLALATRTIGFWMSTDGGATWKQKGAFPPTTEKVKGDNGLSFVTFDKASGLKGKPTPVLYVGAFTSDASGGVWKSTDGGETWTQMTGGLKSPARSAVASDGTFYVTFSGNKVEKGTVFKAARADSNLTECTPPVDKPERQAFCGVAIDPTNPKIIYVAETPGVFNLDTFRSTDAGATWTAVGKKKGIKNLDTRLDSQWFGNISQIALNPFNPKEAWLSDWHGVLRTPDITDPNVPWDYVSAGDEEVVPFCLVCPRSGPFLVSGLGDVNGDFHYSLTTPPDGSFSTRSDPLSIGATSGIDFCETDPTQWVRVMSSYVNGATGNVSTDNGKTWLPFATIPDGARLGRVAMSATDPKVIVWQPEDGNLYYTSDRGKTWAKSATAPSVQLSEFRQDAQPLASDRVKPSTFYLVHDLDAQGKTEIWRSTDGGATWAVASTIEHPDHATVSQYKIVAAPGKAGTLWLSLGTLYKSTDEGATFTPVPGVSCGGLLALGKPAPNHQNPAVFVMGSVKEVTGIFRSDDDGATWERIDNPETPIFDQPKVMGADRQVFGRAYIGTDGRGIYYNDVPGKTVN